MDGRHEDATVSTINQRQINGNSPGGLSLQARAHTWATHQSTSRTNQARTCGILLRPACRCKCRSKGRLFVEGSPDFAFLIFRRPAADLGRMDAMAQPCDARHLPAQDMAGIFPHRAPFHSGAGCCDVTKSSTAAPLPHSPLPIRGSDPATPPRSFDHGAEHTCCRHL